MGTDSRKEKSEVCLDLDRPSHGRSKPDESRRLTRNATFAWDPRASHVAPGHNTPPALPQQARLLRRRTWLHRLAQWRTTSWPSIWLTATPLSDLPPDRSTPSGRPVSSLIPAHPRPAPPTPYATQTPWCAAPPNTTPRHKSPQ